MHSIFVAVILDHRSVIPDSADCFATLEDAKLFVTQGDAHEGAFWEEHAEGKFVFGYGEDDHVDEPLAVVFGIDTIRKALK